MIKPEFWSDMRTGRLSDTAKVIFIAMLNIADDEGKLIGDPEYLLSTIYPYSNCLKRNFVNALDDLEGALCIIKYNIKRFNYIIVPNFNKHQRIDKPQPSKIPDPDWSSKTIRDYFYNYQDGICPDCKRDMILESRGQNPPEPYDNNENIDNEEYTNGNNSRVLSIDHIFPQSGGGSHNISNLRAICITCNKRKYNKVLPNGVEDYSNSIPGMVDDEKKISKEKEKEKENESPHPLALFVKENLLSVSKLDKQLTNEDCERLYNEIPEKLLREVLQDMDNYKPLLKKYKSVNLTLRKWLKIREERSGDDGKGTRANFQPRRKGDLDVDKYKRELATEKERKE